MTSRLPRSPNRAARRGRPAPSRPQLPALHLPLAALLLTGNCVAVQAQDLASCRTLPDDQQRLACYDALAGRAPQDAGTAPEELFGLEATASAERLQRERGDEPVEALQQSVATVSADGYGKLRIGLANGQVWAQIDSDRLRLKPGDAVRIRRAAMGSYLLSLQTGGRAIRVRRVADPVAPD